MKPILEPILSVPEPTHGEEGSIAFDADWAYLAAPSALWRIERSMRPGAAVDRLPVEKGAIAGLYVFDTELFVLKEAGADGSGHVLLRSRDQGSSFEPIDDGLIVDQAGFRTRLPVTRLARSGGRLFVNAGGGMNLFVSTDGALSWIVLYGTRATQACYAGEFLLRGEVVLMGGECPLDSAYLMRGALGTDGASWVSQPRSVAPGDLSNRNVQFISEIEGWNVLAAGVEGGLLTSADEGATWQWSLQCPLSKGTYPYVKSLASWTLRPDTAFIGGFDKAKGSGYLAVSLDRGRQWEDVSGSLYAAAKGAEVNLATVQHPDGTIVTALLDPSAQSVILARVISL